MASQKSLMTQEELQFRLSKKVAELTKVVHLLFTKNREKELEVEAVKEAYEKEINVVINDAKVRLSKLENDITQQQQVHEQDVQQIHDEYAQQLQERDDALRKIDSSQNEEKNKLSRENDLLKRQVKSLTEERDQVAAKMNLEITSLNDDRDQIDIKLNQQIENLNQQLKNAKVTIEDLTTKLDEISQHDVQEIESLTKQLNGKESLII